MDKKLQQFLDGAFAPYGEFPARADVVQELLANLLEKFNDLKKQGKGDSEAYQLTIDSFGDVSEIMAQVPHGEAKPGHPVRNDHGEDPGNGEPSLFKTIVGGIKEVTGGKPTPIASALEQADLTDTNLAGKDFSMSALTGASFDRANLRGAKFRATNLKNASFAEADLTGADFMGSGMEGVKFDKADLTGAKLKGSGLKGATFAATKLVNTEFNQSDLSSLIFDGLTLDGVIFNSTSLKNTSFKNATFRNVSFHHAAVKHAIFDGATMDKLTYALLKGAKATLNDIVVQ